MKPVNALSNTWQHWTKTSVTLLVSQFFGFSSFVFLLHCSIKLPTLLVLSLKGKSSQSWAGRRSNAVWCQGTDVQLMLQHGTTIKPSSKPLFRCLLVRRLHMKVQLHLIRTNKYRIVYDKNSYNKHFSHLSL